MEHGVWKQAHEVRAVAAPSQEDTRRLRAQAWETHENFQPVFRGRRVVIGILAVLCVQFVVFGLVEAWRDSPTFDEQYQLASGVSVLTRHQVRVTLEQPPLWPAVAALPVLAVHPIVPDTRAWRVGDGFAFATQFVRTQDRAGRLRAVTFAGRLIPLLEAAAVGVLVFGLAEALFGTAAGLLAAGIWLTLPFTLGLGHLNSRDVTFTLVTVLGCWALLRHRRGPSRGTLIALGAVCGLALLARPTALALVPALAVLGGTAGGWRRWKTVGRVALVLVVAWATVWVSYRVLVPVPQFRHVPESAVKTTSFGGQVASDLLWPREYAVGLREQARISSAPANAYIYGKYISGQSLVFWPASIVIKLSLSTLIVAAAGIVCAFVGHRHARRDALLVLVAPAAAVSVAIALQDRDGGLRYLLPILALGCVTAGAAVILLRLGGLARAGLVVLAIAQLAWYVGSVPNSLAWTAPPFRPGYRFVSDSNLDWGQDYYGLRRFLDRHPDANRVYFGPALVANHIDLNSAGWYAISASALTTYQALTHGIPRLRAQCPVATIGGTILLFHFDRPPALTAPLHTRPRPLCPDGASRVR